jgi:hypothetical protein
MVSANLERVDALPTQVVLFQAGPGPVIKGDHAAGDNYLCPWCERRTLIERGILGGLWDLVIECGDCNRRSATPQLPPGMPLGQPLVMLTVGIYRSSDPVLQNVSVVLAGQPAVERRRAETNRGREAPDPEVVLDAALCEGILTEIEGLLPDLLADLRPTHRRGGASLTPPRVPHRLLQLMDRVEASAHSLREDDIPQVDAAALIELRSAVTVLKRWQRDPAWPALIRSMREPTSYAHTIITLVVASALTDQGNGVALEAAEAVQSQRTADLRLAIGALDRFDVEVKSPTALQDPLPALGARQAKKLVQRLLKKSAAGSRRQLGSERPGLLAIGGFNMSPSHLDMLERASAGALASTTARRPLLAGILIVTCGFSLDNFTQASSGLFVPSEEPSIQDLNLVRFIRNRGYTGSVTVRG